MIPSSPEILLMCVCVCVCVCVCAQTSVDFASAGSQVL